MNNFYTDIIQIAPAYSLSTQCRDINLLEPNTRVARVALIAGAAALGITIESTETFRSAANQQADFAAGKTQLDGRTPQTIGTHHFGIAFDLLRIQADKADWTAADYFFLADLAPKCGLVWGGDWGNPANLHDPQIFHDWDHVQLCTVEQQDALFGGTWYPESVLGSDGLYYPVTAAASPG